MDGSGEQFAKIGEVELCYETFGDPGRPAMLLIMGLGTQMLAWREDFCAELVDRGFFVVRYDNRDIGRSTHFDRVRPPSPTELLLRTWRRPAYTLADMADDAAGLLSHLDVDAAHVVGASMGGMIAQELAARHPERVLSLTSIMSTTGGALVGRPSLRLYPMFLRKPARTREAYVERTEGIFALIGSPGFARDDDAVRELAGRSYDRDPGSAGTGRQLGAIIAAGDRRAGLARISAPTLVVHGTADRLVSSSGARATVKAIADAHLMLIDGMGHDLPRAVWPRVIDAIVGNAARARGAVPSALA